MVKAEENKTEEIEYRYICHCDHTTCRAGDRKAPDKRPKFCVRTGEIVNWLPNTVGNQRDLQVRIFIDPNPDTIGFIQQIEKHIDKALSPLGFARSTTEKGDIAKLNYYRFGKCQ